MIFANAWLLAFNIIEVLQGTIDLLVAGAGEK
jgi:hypothetical protein